MGGLPWDGETVNGWKTRAMDETRRQYATYANLTRRANLHAACGRVDWFAWLAERMDLPPGAVLDVGCGPGWFWRRAPALSPGIALTLLDTSPAMVSEAEAALAQTPLTVSAVTGDAQDLPFPDAQFDAVVMMHMLYHVPDIARALDEAARVLRPGGRIHVTTNARTNLAEITSLAAEIFGTTPFDQAAEVFSLDDAEEALGARFEGVHRHDLTETYVCHEPGIVLDFLTSMPPAQDAASDKAAALKARVHDACAVPGGLRAEKQSGLITATKPVS